MFALKRASVTAARRAATAKRSFSTTAGSWSSEVRLAQKWLPPALLVLGGAALVMRTRRGSMWVNKTSEERTAVKLGWDDFTSKALIMNDDDEEDDEEDDDDDE